MYNETNSLGIQCDKKLFLIIDVSIQIWQKLFDKKWDELHLTKVVFDKECKKLYDMNCAENLVKEYWQWNKTQFGLHSKKKSTSKHLLWCFRLSQIENSIQYLEGPKWYLEGPNGILKDHDRHLGVRLVPKMPIMVLPDTIWSFQVLNRVLYLWQSEAPKKVLWSTFFS